MSISDDGLVAAIRARAMDPLTRTDVTIAPSPPVRGLTTMKTIATTEALLGFPLHPFLKRMYLEVGDGGFGPGYGLLSLAPSGPPGDERSLAVIYHAHRKGRWPEKLLPLWDWGDAVWSCVDARSHDGTIITHDGAGGATETAFSIRTWLDAWARGVDLWKEIYEDKEGTVINPFTKRPVTTKVRGAAKGTPYKARN